MGTDAQRKCLFTVDFILLYCGVLRSLLGTAWRISFETWFAIKFAYLLDN